MDSFIKIAIYYRFNVGGINREVLQFVLECSKALDIDKVIYYFLNCHANMEEYNDMIGFFRTKLQI